MTDKKYDAETGRYGEDAAAKFLIKNGYRILARNYKCRYGEIDIIAATGGFVCFTEVKTRKNTDYGEAREFVTKSKQGKVIRAAECWLIENDSTLQPRFDVVEVYAPEGAGGPVKINLLDNAYELRPRY